MGSITSVRAIHFGKALCDCEFHVARTIVYIPPPSSLYPLSTYWRSRECHNIVHGCFSSFPRMYLSEWGEHIMLSNQYITCSTTVWFILKQTHKEMRVPSWRLFPGGRHELWWKVVLGNHTSSTAHWDALCSYDCEWRITEGEHKFNTGALLQHSKVINPPAKKFRLGSNQSN